MSGEDTSGGPIEQSASTRPVEQFGEEHALVPLTRRNAEGEVLERLPEVEEQIREAVALDPAQLQQHIQLGNRIVANRGISQVLGFGHVVGPYEFVPDVEHGHHLRVDWEDTQPRAVNKGGWRRTLVRLNRRDYEQLAAASALPTEQWQGFQQRAFELLDGLHVTPTAAYYVDHRAAFME